MPAICNAQNIYLQEVSEEGPEDIGSSKPVRLSMNFNTHAFETIVLQPPHELVVYDSVPLETNATTRELILYTKNDYAKKKLRSPVDIILTLTPAVIEEEWVSITWKKFSFLPYVDEHPTVSWSSETGFTLATETNKGLLKAGNPSITIPPGHKVVLNSHYSWLEFEEEGSAAELHADHIQFKNNSNYPQRVLLYSVDPKKVETDQLSPVIDFGTVHPGNIITCGVPVMLQAYAQSRSEERRPILDNSLNPLFVDNTNNPQPIDLRTLGPYMSFRLYSQRSGKITLERDEIVTEKKSSGMSDS